MLNSTCAEETFAMLCMQHGQQDHGMASGFARGLQHSVAFKQAVLCVRQCVKYARMRGFT